MILKPFLKWVGGKGQIIDQLFEEFVTEEPPTTFVEPFVGGGSVFLELLNRLEQQDLNFSSINKIFISDFNKDLINVYKAIKGTPTTLLKNLNTIKENYDKAKDIKYEARHKAVIADNDIIKDVIKKGKSYVYYFYRKLYNSTKNVILKSALFIFLNKTGFRGLYRVSKNGDFNVPFGNYKNPSIFSKTDIESLSIAFKKYNVEFTHYKYQDALKFLEGYSSPKKGIKGIKNILVYLDPPYYPVDKNSFLAYSADGFDISDQEKLRDFLIKNNKYIYFVESNLDCEGIRKLYSTFSISSINCRRRINSKNPEATENEVIIKNF